jgi:hypothetical protein
MIDEGDPAPRGNAPHFPVGHQHDPSVFETNDFSEEFIALSVLDHARAAYTHTRSVAFGHKPGHFDDSTYSSQTWAFVDSLCV